MDIWEGKMIKLRQVNYCNIKVLLMYLVRSRLALEKIFRQNFSIMQKDMET